MKIDIATFRGKDAIKHLNQEAFPETENKLTADVALGSLSDRVVSLVTEKGCGIAGYVAFHESSNRRRR
ncbi:hypothetical protein N8702_00220 [Verrucomicrobia bacterium]|nr:hypothetical protein [bacterium]MDA7660110.1 hypothetical protein [Verrucomicrobiota bacterium]